MNFINLRQPVLAAPRSLCRTEQSLSMGKDTNEMEEAVSILGMKSLGRKSCSTGPSVV